MGTLFYGGTDMPIDIEDRALAHLKIVITTKLRRNESFTVSWKHPSDRPGGRTTLWLHPAIPLRFVFESDVAPPLDRTWMEELATSAHSTGGIVLDADHFAGEYADEA